MVGPHSARRVADVPRLREPGTGGFPGRGRGDAGVRPGRLPREGSDRSAVSAVRGAAAPPTRPRRLGVRGRRVLLVTHIAAAGAWLGVDVAMAVLIVTSATPADLRTRAVSLQALELVTVGPLLVCGLLCLLSGLGLGLGSRWG